MDPKLPSDESIKSLTKFLKSLVQKIDYVLGDDSSISNYSESDLILCNNNISIPEAVAFEEVAQNSCSPLSLEISKSGVWDVSNVTDYLNKMEDVEPHFNLHEIETLSKKLSDISNSEVDTDECFSDISSFCDKVPDYSRPPQPFYMLPGNPFHLFNVSSLDASTDYTHYFPKTKRSAAYYGEQPYSYGQIHHPSRPFSENEYLLKVISYAEVVLPGIKFNSALVHKYNTGESFIPHHSDDEDDIERDSKIVTISFGESRFIEFKNIASGSIRSQKLKHGDIFVMDKTSQSFYTHSVPEDLKTPLGTRISVTLRQIVRPVQTGNVPILYSPVTPVSSSTSTESTVTKFLQDLNSSEDPDHPPENCTPQPSVESHQSTVEPTDNVIPNTQFVCPDDPAPPLCNSPSTQAQAIHTPYTPKTVYISSSMFRHLDVNRLSSNSQQATKFFYPGATASKMMSNLQNDQDFQNLDKSEVSKIFLLTGSNDIDGIYYGNTGESLQKSSNDIVNIIRYLQSLFITAKLHIINILPRKTPGRLDIIRLLNADIEAICNADTKLAYVDTFHNRMFSYRDGSRKSEFFIPYGKFSSDNVHMNAKGVTRLGKHLKYLAHNSNF